jgi:uncharacterized protein
MMKLLLLLLVVGVVVFVFASRRRTSDKSNGADPITPAASADQPAPMVACVHCGLHLPRSDAQADATGRLFCSEAHRLAGPR